MCVCVAVFVGGGRVYMKRHYHIKDMLGFSVLMVITLPTIGAHCSDHNNKGEKKNMDGGVLKGSGGGYNWLGLSGYVNTAHLFN